LIGDMNEWISGIRQFSTLLIGKPESAAPDMRRSLNLLNCGQINSAINTVEAATDKKAVMTPCSLRSSRSQTRSRELSAG
jgi:hypothetical protein